MALSSEETSVRIAHNGIQNAKCSWMLDSGIKHLTKLYWQLEIMVTPPTIWQGKVMKASWLSTWCWPINQTHSGPNCPMTTLVNLTISDTMGGGSKQAGGGAPSKRSRVELICNDAGGYGGSGEAMDGANKGESSPGCIIHSRWGGARGHMLPGSNGKCSRHDSKENQDQHQVNAVVECQNQGK